MNEIKFVSLSDMHLGQNSGILTRLKTASDIQDPLDASPVLDSLCLCLRNLLKSQKNKPTLILNGDILEMALTTTNQAAMVFERFIERVMPDDKDKQLFKDIIYVPGNHDHHLWETARETQYVEFIRNSVDNFLDIPRHATHLLINREIGEPPPSYFLENLIRRKRQDENRFDIRVAYPNLGLLSDDNSRCVLFHHGHFIESIYHLMSDVMTMAFPDRKQPENVWDTEAENFAWIDFFWSAMGRSGQAGKKVEAIYESLTHKKARNKLIDNISKSMAEKINIPVLNEWMEEKTIAVLLKYIAEQIVSGVKSQQEDVLNDDSKKGLRAWMEGPLLLQLRRDLEKLGASTGGTFPDKTTLIFGHTHKPFEEPYVFDNFPGWVNVYNTGGWVVENFKPQKLHGASMILIDSTLNVTSIRLYNETENFEDYKVNVRQSPKADEEEKKFSLEIEKKIKDKDNKAEWRKFSQEVGKALLVRRKHLEARIERLTT